MNKFIFCALVAFLGLVVVDAKLDLEVDIPVCMAEVNIPIEQLASVRDNVERDVYPENLNCLYKCLLQKQGALGPNAEFNADKVIDYFVNEGLLSAQPEGSQRDGILEQINTCKNSDEVDHCARAVKIAQCALSLPFLTPP